MGVLINFSIDGEFDGEFWLKISAEAVKSEVKIGRFEVKRGRESLKFEVPISLRSDRGSHQTSTDKVQAMYPPISQKVKNPLPFRKREKYPLHSNFRRWWF